MDAPLHAVPAPRAEETRVVEQPEPFEEFFEANHPRLFASLCLVTGSRHEAEEIMQDAFLAVWERWDRVSAMGDPVGYLFRTAMNVFRKRLRRAALGARRTIGLAPMPDAFAQVDARDALVRAMRDLTPQQRAAVVLTGILDYSSEEAGKMLGVADSTVRVLAAKARTSMRPKVEDPT